METKGISVLTATMKAVKADDGTYDITLTMPKLDRDDEVIDAKALEWTTPGRMPIDVDHGMTVLTTVGSGLPVYDGDALKLNDFRFASTALAQDVKTLVDEEHISKVSVAFMAAEREKDEKDGKIHIRKAELLNAAIVAIPSLREADIVRAAKSALAAKVGARNSTDDAGRLQQIHDLSVDNGAICGDGKAVTRTSVKAVAGSYEEQADRLRQALREANPDVEWLWIRATFDDSVIYETEADDGTVSTWQANYTETDDGYDLDTPVEVDLAEIVVPPVKSADTDPEQTAAQAAVPPAEVLLAKAKATIADAELTLLP